jgi:hypothetical protein
LKKNVTPRSGAASAQLLPPWRSMIRRTIAGATPVRSVEPLEHAEKLAGVAHVEPDPVVPNEIDSPVRLVARVATDFNPRLGPFATVFEGIGEQVHPNLFQHRWIGAVGRHLADMNRHRKDLRSRAQFVQTVVDASRRSKLTRISPSTARG